MLPLQDTRVISAHQGLLVQAQRLEVMFKDGSLVHLHPVAHAPCKSAPVPVVDAYLRALQVEGLRWLVVDLRRLAGHQLQDDLIRCLPRDVHGIVMYTLRGQFPNARSFVNAVHALAQTIWWHLDTAPLPEAVAAP